ncbi:MAG: ankyrin repeat domain-containing protein, partial [Alphaproteobacteria bacterium]|nr:ankyrin repeat domain-containing protein [Alphaproteobacteria bacterium]
MAENINKNFLNPDWWKRATIKDVEAEIAKGADVNAKDDKGITALMYDAAYTQNPETIKILVQRGADINSRNNESWTTLMIAAANNTNPQILKTIVDSGADINATD